MNNDSQRTLIASEKWKLLVFTGMILVAGLGYLIPDYIGHILGVDSVWVEFGSVLLIFMSFGWILNAIRCQNCGLRLVFYAMSHRDIGEWLKWLLEADECPKCGYAKSNRVKKT